MQVDTDTLEVLEINLKFDKEYKQVSVDKFVKDTNSFAYVLPSTYFPNNNVENITEGVALCLRSICSSDDKFENSITEVPCF